MNCCLMVKLVSIQTLKAFSAKLFSTGSTSSMLWCMGAIPPQEFTPSWTPWDSCWLNSPACPYPMNVSTTLWFINHSSQFCIFQNVSVCILCLVTQVIMKIINSVGPRSILGYTTSDWPPTGLYAANHSPLSSTVQPVCNHHYLSSSYLLHLSIGMLQETVLTTVALLSSTRPVI